MILFGEGDAAKILCALTRQLPITIKAISPFSSNAPAKIYGRPVISKEDLARTKAVIIIAAIVDVPTRLTELQRSGIARSRIITLR